MVVHPARAWILNLDAEAELENPSAHTPSRAVAERSRALAGRVEALLGPGDVILSEGLAAPGFQGRAWCPTPSALRAIAAAGAIVPPAPPLDVLARVNHRRFSAELGQTLPGARFVTSRAETLATIAGPSPAGRWLLKRPFGFAGRGRMIAGPGPLDARESGWIEASFARGDGLQVEPWVERAGDFALHGWLSFDGVVVMGEATEQRCDASGAWLGSARAADGSLSAGELRALVESFERAADALRSAAYFGPFCVDAFRFRDRSGALAFNARSEINARYSMGWAIGMGDRRPDLGA